MAGILTVAQAVRLTEARKVSKGWRGNCPCDPAHKGLLKIDANENGALLLRCHGGCKFFWLTQTLREKRDALACEESAP